ncbi:hypothetical protein T4A_8991 [Trichinella pseudospiralis]|uniref:Uncharacterized protein n=1 Tax=Trichinella pseudospiralis TaxID=6337 RepID=A0A0V1DTA8_TRIPS|nr:hypothetical protein T4A_3059 [Trichinella pseudospiralis]KRY64817.1 hypothetical protein T4A_8991 [Trichinella pseudospiralis]
MLFTFYDILKVKTIINVVSLINNASAITISATDKPKTVIINLNATFESHFFKMSFMYYNSSSQDRGNAKSVSFVIAITAFASSVFNREHYRQERHALKITDFFLGLNKNLCFITSASTDIPIYVDSKIDINRILSTENGIR